MEEPDTKERRVTVGQVDMQLLSMQKKDNYEKLFQDY